MRRTMSRTGGDILFAGRSAAFTSPSMRASTSPATRRPSGTRPSGSPSRKRRLDVSLVCWDITAADRMGGPVRTGAETTRQVGGHGGEALQEKKRPFEEAILADLIANDPDMSGWQSLPRDIQARERNFCFNSIRGSGGTWKKQKLGSYEARKFGEASKRRSRLSCPNFTTSQLLNFRVQGMPNTAFALAVVTAATSSKGLP